MKVNKPVKQSETTVRFEVRMVHWSEVHLEASTEGSIVPSVAEYVLVQAVADGSVKIHNVSQLAHLRFMRLSKKYSCNYYTFKTFFDNIEVGGE